MLKRLHIYFTEMYPLLPRLVLGFIVFLEIYFIVLLNYGITDFSIGIQELVGGWTIFTFLMMLRIADDFKDYELDCRLFAHRPLPSGRVTKADLKICIYIVMGITILLNIVFMNNVWYFFFLFTYGILMAVWFFQKHKIQKNLPLALITHNPVQMIMNIYIISFTCIKYSLDGFTWVTFLAAFTLYFPALIWEISRKIRAPEEETEYVTYSKLFGYIKSIKFVLLLTWVDIITNFILVYNLNRISVILLFLNSCWITWVGYQYIKKPTSFKFVTKMERYTYIQESIMLITVVIFLLIGKI